MLTLGVSSNNEGLMGYLRSWDKSTRNYLLITHNGHRVELVV